MKRLVVAAPCLLAAVAFAPSALADTPGCVTRAEYRAVHRGDSIRRVHRILDTDGRRVYYATEVGGYVSQGRRYRTCRPHSSVEIQYIKKAGGIWRLLAKSAIWS
jgi:hypothetical protein